MQKSILASKTFWLNFLAAVVMVVQALSGEPWFDPSVQTAILAVTNIGLRFLTGQPVVLGSVGKGMAIVALAFSLTLVGCAGSAFTGIPKGTPSVDIAQVAQGVAVLAAGLAAVAAVPMPGGVAVPEVLQQIQYWNQYSSGVSSAMARAIAGTAF